MPPSLKPSLSPVARTWLPVRLLLARAPAWRRGAAGDGAVHHRSPDCRSGIALQRAPTTFWIIYLLVLGLLGVGGIYLVWRVMRLGRPAGESRAVVPAKPPDEETLRGQMERHAAAGVPVDTIAASWRNCNGGGRRARSSWRCLARSAPVNLP